MSLFAGHGWQAVRWGAAGAVAVAAHFGGAWVAMNWASHPAPQGEPPAAVMIELAPLPVAANNAPEMDMAPGPQQAEAKELEQPVESKVAENEPPPPEPEPEPVPEPEIKVPEIEKPAEVTLPISPKVDPAKEREKKRKREERRKQRIEEARERKEREREREKERAARAKARDAQREAVAQRTSAPSGAPGPTSPSAASASSGANASAMASWRGALMAHLNRYKRFPDGGGSGGTVAVSFSINRAGAVTGARLSRSSGNSALDSEAVALVRRASPVPAPPAHISGSSVSISVPIRYSR